MGYILAIIMTLIIAGITYFSLKGVDIGVPPKRPKPLKKQSCQKNH